VDDPALWTLIGLLGAFGASFVAVVLFALTSGFRRIEDRLGRVEDRIVRVEDRLGGVESRPGAVEARLPRVEG
jgi:hypothetical protein